MYLVTQYKNIKQKLSELDGKISKSMDMRDFNSRIPLKKTSQLIKQCNTELKSSIGNYDLRHVVRTLQSQNRRSF